MVFTYHEILPGRSRYSYAVSRATLEDHLRYLGEWRASHPERAPVITFDDGHVTQLEYGAPALEDYNFRGIFFITAGWVESRAGYLGWRQLRDLASRGHEVQSHSWSHAYLTGCSDSELQREVAVSKDALEQNLGVQVTAISMPGGRWDRRVKAACEEAGYTRFYTSDPWRHPDKGESWRIVETGRYMVTRGTGIRDLRHLLEARKPPLAAGVKRTVKQLLRAVAGDQLYQSAWRMANRKSTLQQDCRGLPPQGQSNAGSEGSL